VSARAPVSGNSGRGFGTSGVLRDQLPYALAMVVRRTGHNVWRPGVGLQLTWLVICVAFVAGTAWLALSGGGLSAKDKITFGSADLAAVVFLPVILLRWRMVLEHNELILVFLRARRIPLRNIVGAKTVPKQGLTFVLADGQEHSFSALGNTAWGHRRTEATRADLAARTVLTAAAQARGEVPEFGYRLPPMRGLKKAAIEGGIWAMIVGFFLGN